MSCSCAVRCRSNKNKAKPADTGRRLAGQSTWIAAYLKQLCMPPLWNQICNVAHQITVALPINFYAPGLADAVQLAPASQDAGYLLSGSHGPHTITCAAGCRAPAASMASAARGLSQPKPAGTSSKKVSAAKRCAVHRPESGYAFD